MTLIAEAHGYGARATTVEAPECRRERGAPTSVSDDMGWNREKPGQNRHAAIKFVGVEDAEGRGMKAITICQPYAEMIAGGEKVIENRSWPTSHRGVIAIHAGKSRAWMDPGDEAKYPGMAFGAIVATARLVDCVRVEKLPPALANNPHANGPWCWILENVNRVTPVEARGAQGLWDLETSLALTLLPEAKS